MAKLLSVLVDSEHEGLRLDAFMSSIDGAPSRSSCVKLIEQGAVTINTTVATSKSERLVLGDRVEFLVDEDRSHKDGLLEPNYDIKLDIVYEDEYLLVINKQAGLVCHPSPGHESDTLANALVAHCGYEHLGLLQGEDRPGIVHRLDMDTTGLLVCAKSDEVQAALQNLIRLRVLDRRYLALVHGSFARDEGSITTGIARSKRNPLKMAISDDPGAREAITTFRVLEQYEAHPRDDGYSLLECHLYTGRTHQIRLHMRYIGHALVGDALYGRGGKFEQLANLGLKRQFLHSWKMSFEHPISSEELSFSSALPQDLKLIRDNIQDRLIERSDYAACVGDFA